MEPHWAHAAGDGTHVEGEHACSLIHARCGSLQPPCRHILPPFLDLYVFYREGECVDLRQFRKTQTEGKETLDSDIHTIAPTMQPWGGQRQNVRKRHRSKQWMGTFVLPTPWFTSISSCICLGKHLWICKPYLLIPRCWDDRQHGQMGKSLSSQGSSPVRLVQGTGSRIILKQWVCECFSFFTPIKVVVLFAVLGPKSRTLTVC